MAFPDNRDVDKESLGKRIRTQRKAVPMNQAQLAKQVGVSQGTISDYERGRFEAPSAEVILKIAVALRVDPIWLFFGKGMPNAWMAQVEDEAHLLGLYRSLDERGRAIMFGTARTAIESQPDPSPADPFKTAPRVVSGELIPARQMGPRTVYKRQ